MNSTIINNKIPILESERLLLKPITQEHCTETYVSWMNDPEVIRYLETGGNYTLDTLSVYIVNTVTNKVYFWGIHIKESNKHIGNIKIDPINFRHGYGEYGILMGDRSEWGKGYAMEASKVIFDFCFKILQLRKVNLGVISSNETAIALYKKLDFVVEGVFKQHGYYENNLEDLIRMAKFNN